VVCISYKASEPYQVRALYESQREDVEVLYTNLITNLIESHSYDFALELIDTYPSILVMPKATLLMGAFKNKIPNDKKESAHKLMSKLIEAGCDVDQKEAKDGSLTALECAAAANEDYDTTKFLLQNGAKYTPTLNNKIITSQPKYTSVDNLNEIKTICIIYAKIHAYIKEHEIKVFSQERINELAERSLILEKLDGNKILENREEENEALISFLYVGIDNLRKELADIKSREAELINPIDKFKVLINLKSISKIPVFSIKTIFPGDLSLNQEEAFTQNFLDIPHIIKIINNFNNIVIRFLDLIVEDLDHELLKAEEKFLDVYEEFVEEIEKNKATKKREDRINEIFQNTDISSKLLQPKLDILRKALDKILTLDPNIENEQAEEFIKKYAEAYKFSEDDSDIGIQLTFGSILSLYGDKLMSKVLGSSYQEICNQLRSFSINYNQMYKNSVVALGNVRDKESCASFTNILAKINSGLINVFEEIIDEKSEEDIAKTKSSLFKDIDSFNEEYKKYIKKKAKEHREARIEELLKSSDVKYPEDSNDELSKLLNKALTKLPDASDKKLKELIGVYNSALTENNHFQKFKNISSLFMNSRNYLDSTELSEIIISINRILKFSPSFFDESDVLTQLEGLNHDLITCFHLIAQDKSIGSIKETIDPKLKDLKEKLEKKSVKIAGTFERNDGTEEEEQRIRDKKHQATLEREIEKRKEQERREIEQRKEEEQTESVRGQNKIVTLKYCLSNIRTMLNGKNKEVMKTEIQDQFITLVSIIPGDTKFQASLKEVLSKIQNIIDKIDLGSSSLLDDVAGALNKFKDAVIDTDLSNVPEINKYLNQLKDSINKIDKKALRESQKGGNGGTKKKLPKRGDGSPLSKNNSEASPGGSSSSGRNGGGIKFVPSPSGPTSVAQAFARKRSTSDTSKSSSNPEPGRPDEAGSSSAIEPGRPDEAGSSSVIEPGRPDEAGSSSVIEPGRPDEAGSSSTTRPRIQVDRRKQRQEEDLDNMELAFKNLIIQLRSERENIIPPTAWRNHGERFTDIKYYYYALHYAVFGYASALIKNWEKLNGVIKDEESFGEIPDPFIRKVCILKNSLMHFHREIYLDEGIGRKGSKTYQDCSFRFLDHIAENIISKNGLTLKNFDWKPTTGHESTYLDILRSSNNQSKLGIDSKIDYAISLLQELQEISKVIIPENKDPGSARRMHTKGEIAAQHPKFSAIAYILYIAVGEIRQDISQTSQRVEDSLQGMARTVLESLDRNDLIKSLKRSREGISHKDDSPEDVYRRIEDSQEVCMDTERITKAISTLERAKETLQARENQRPEYISSGPRLR